MGIFGSVAQAKDPLVYINELPDPDGKIHTMLFKLFDAVGQSAVAGADGALNQKLDTYLGLLQGKGREIIDVKINSIAGSGVTGQVTVYHVLVIFK